MHTVLLIPMTGLTFLNNMYGTAKLVLIVNSYAELKLMNSLHQMHALKLQLVVIILHLGSSETTEIWKLRWIFPSHDEFDEESN